MIENIVATEHEPGTSATLRIKGEFLPLELTAGNARLLSAYRSAAQQVGLELDGEFTGGCADSGLTSSVRHTNPVRDRTGWRTGAYR
jgi:glutamate carboxypeptidase